MSFDHVNIITLNMSVHPQVSDSDSLEFIDDVDKDPDYNVIENARPKHCFLNRAEHRNRLVSYTSSESVSSSDSEGNGMPSLIGPLNEIKSRKRTRNPTKHKQYFAKTCRNSGKRYINKKGNICEGKVFLNVPCNCRMKCDDKISNDDRKAMFDLFWNMADFGKQNSFICGLVQKSEVKRRHERKDGGLLRKGSNKYFLKTAEGISVQVCQKFFFKNIRL